MAPNRTDSRCPVLSRARVAIVGRGRLGTALCSALGAAGVQVRGPLGRGDRPGGADAVAEAAPHSLALFDELVARTQALSAREALL